MPSIATVNDKYDIRNIVEQTPECVIFNAYDKINNRRVQLQVQM